VTPLSSPLDEITITGNKSRVFLKREDLLEPAGGNKVRRFYSFFKENRKINTLVALSDPGAHTFYVLKHFLKNGPNSLGADRMIFLERNNKLNAYQNAIRKTYTDNPEISVSRAPFLFQYIKLKILALLPTYKSIGVGGHCKVSKNPFVDAFTECSRQLTEKNITGKVCHLFCIASGMMADGFLQATTNDKQHCFAAVMTGAPLTKNLIKLKYGNKIKLFEPEPTKEIGMLGTSQLDPIHTGHLPELLSRAYCKSFPNIVLWMTQPRLPS
jgi:hypothetical protein